VAYPPEQTRTRNIAVMLTKMEKDSSSGLLAPELGKVARRKWGRRQTPYAQGYPSLAR
jgi:hypothetical protein